MKQSILILPICFLFTISASVFAQGDPSKGEAIYATCSACHGQNGEGLQTTKSPRLAGLSDWYLLGQLEKFRTGLRGTDPEDTYGVQMALMAKALKNGQEILDVVAYIQTLQASNPVRTEKTGDPTRGQEEYLNCSRCHGSGGQGLKYAYNKIGAPRIAGQHDWYLIQQWENFKTGMRGATNDKGGMLMRSETKIHKDQTILDIIAYLGTLE